MSSEMVTTVFCFPFSYVPYSTDKFCSMYVWTTGEIIHYPTVRLVFPSFVLEVGFSTEKYKRLESRIWKLNNRD